MSANVLPARAALTLLLLVLGCSTPAIVADPLAGHRAALEATDPHRTERLNAGSPEEAAAISRFKDLFASLDAANIKKRLRATYAENVWFNDTLKEIRSLDALEEYMLANAANTESCAVEFLDEFSRDGDYYFRWIMRIKFKKLEKGKTHSSIGMTHIRLDKDGRIIFHQDYWDAASAFYEKLPIVGGMIRMIKKRL